MADVTETHRKFVSEPIGNKPVSAVPGIGRAHQGTLNDRGNNITRAYELLGIFLGKGMEEGGFKRWLQEKLPESNAVHRDCCYKALNEYFRTHNF